jgi:tripartite-type tricarboxylate transporter receptor subunit TctC
VVFSRLLWKVVVAGSAFLLGAPGFLHAQESWSPTRPLRLVLGYTPGGAADAVARDLAPVMEKALGQPVVVDYRPGAGGAIGAEAVKTAAPDGYTLGLIDGAPLTIIPNARKVPYDPRSDFSYLGVVSKSPLVVLVNPSVPARTLPELLALARAQPGQLAYSSSGNGTIHHLAGELLKAASHSDLMHVPYKGAAPAMNDLMGGAVAVSFATIAPAVPVVQGGRARAIAVTSAREVPALPGVKTVAAQGLPGYDAQGWFVLAAPKGLPAPVVRRLNAALNAALQTPAVRERLLATGSDIEAGPPEAAAELVATDFRKWGQVIREQQLHFD